MREEGFTLIEVLAALVIFSVAIVGLIQLNTQSIRTVSSLESKMLAGVIADNVIVEARRKNVALGEKDGEEIAKGRTFKWQQEITETEMENFYRIVVTVMDDRDDRVLVQRTAYRGTQK